MSSGRTCHQCGAPLPGNAADWLCPRCLLGQAGADAAARARSPDSSLLSSTVHSFGDYELLHEIARGGMGVVYKARQVSLNRIVAVKVLLFGKLAGDEYVKRFRAEAEAAASLQHPNIVAIHEVGEHESQQYFSMDYVEGTDLAELVREAPLPAKRAATYLKIIAEAIHYAHQHGLLHRDLKPSNILIDAHDEPRVTDFGLAKRLQPLTPALSTSEEATKSQRPATSKTARVLLPPAESPATSAASTDLTVTGQVLGTPHYMPPEQAAGKRAEATPASDVYSLGAILYHLLTGRPPFLADTLEGALTQLLHNEPAPPRLLNASVPRDLETICLKCLNKEASHRYTSAQSLVEDLGRWLNGEPILARPVSFAEKLWRWCRRRPGMAGLLVALQAVVVLGLSGILWQWQRAERNAQTAANQSQRAEQHAAAEAAQRVRAEAQAKKSEQVSRFLADMLQGVQPDVALGRDTTVLREILSRTERRLSHELQDQPEVEAELRHTIGLVYLALGEPVKAEAMFREALRLRTAVLGEMHLDTLDSLFRLALSLHGQVRMEEYELMIHRAFELHLQVLGENDRRIADLLNNLASVTQSYTNSEELFRRALAILDRIGATHDFLRGLTLSALATNLRLQERLTEAEPIARTAVALHRRIFGDSHPTTAHCLTSFAGLLRELGKFDEAEATLQTSWSVLRKAHGDTNPVAVRALLELAEIQLDRHDQSSARPLLQQVLDATFTWTNTIPSDTASEVMAELGYRLCAEARQYWDQGDALRARDSALNAERVLHPLVVAREAGAKPTELIVLWTRSLYAGALIAVATTDLERPLQARLAAFAKVEAMLMDIYDKIKARPFPDSVTAYHTLAPTQERLVALYLRWEETAPNPARAAKLAEWRQRLDELERQAGRKPQPRISERYQPQ